jgi:hypothetical protein
MTLLLISCYKIDSGSSKLAKGIRYVAPEKIYYESYIFSQKKTKCGYLHAIKLLREVQKNHPNWKTSLVASRINYNLSKVNELGH